MSKKEEQIIKEAQASFAHQFQEIRQNFEMSLDKQLSSLMAEAEVRSRMEAKVEELTASENKLREELESAVDRATEQKLQLKRMSKEKGIERAQAMQKFEKLQAESRAEIEKLKNQLAIAVQEKEEFSEFFQYTEKTMKEKIAALELEASQARESETKAKEKIAKVESALEQEKSSARVRVSESELAIRRLENSVMGDQSRIESYEQQIESIRAQLATQEHESRRKLAAISDEKWGLEIQITQLTKDLEIQRVRMASLDDSQTRIRQLEHELKTSSERKPDFSAFNEVRNQFNDEFNRVKAERASLEERYAAAQEEMGSLRSQILKAQAELEKSQIAAEKSMAALKMESEVRLASSIEAERVNGQKRFQEREAEFLNEMREMRRELAEANARASTLNGQLEAARERLVHFSEIEQESCAEIVRLTDLIDKEREENKVNAAERMRIEYSLKKEVDLAQARATQNEQRLQISLETLSQLDTQVSQLRDTNRVLSEEKAKFEVHTLRLTQELARAETSAWDFEESLEKTTAEREKFRMAEAKAKIDFTQAQSDLNRATTDLARLRAAHDETLEINATIQQERDKAKDAIASVTEQKSQLESELKFEKAQALSDQQRLSTDLARVESSLARAESSIEKLKAECEQLKERNAELSQSKSSIESQSNLTGSQAQARIQRLTEDLAKAETVIANNEDQIEKWMKEREVALAKAQAAVEQKAAADAQLSRMRLHENQFRHYANSLGKEKQELAKVGEGLLSELRLLSKTHPLKDYLSATEFEISKVSLQLKTTPTIAPERTAIEINLTKLSEQRDFLRSVLDGSQKHFERQIAQVQALIEKAAALVPPPPPPPAPSAGAVKAVAESSAVEAVPQVEGPVKDVNWERPLDQIV